MTVLLLPVTVFLFAAVSVYGLLHYVGNVLRKRALMARLVCAGDDVSGGWTAVPLRDWLIRFGGIAMPGRESEVGHIRNLLCYAGYRGPEYIRIYNGLRVTLAAMCGGIGFMVCLFTIGMNIRACIVIYMSLATGFFVPKFFLKQRVAARRMRIFRELPDVLDVLMVCLEAGLSFNQSLHRVSGELRFIAPVLSMEFKRYFYEVDSGLPRRQALRNLSDRNGSEDLTSVVNVIVQSLDFGTDIVEALRVYSGFFREEQLQAAEEKAAKVGVKLTFPMVLFILPAFMIIIIGPAVIYLIENLKRVFF
jgi:tight adherence protein C